LTFVIVVSLTCVSAGNDDGSTIRKDGLCAEAAVAGTRLQAVKEIRHALDTGQIPAIDEESSGDRA
jgi:hypothetical protein